MTADLPARLEHIARRLDQAPQPWAARGASTIREAAALLREMDEQQAIEDARLGTRVLWR